MRTTIAQIREQLATGAVTHVLLDMDGTLLDKYFDDYFWEHLVPEKYAELHDLSFGRAKEALMEKYRSQEETLNWTDIDYWSRVLGLDILALKEQIHHLIDVHPHVVEFLQLMRERGKKVYIATNAHDKVLAMKLTKTALGKHLDGAITSAGMGCPKEQQGFWDAAERKLRFHREQALFVDDTLAVLRSAKRFGIGHLVYKAKANSKVPPGTNREFATIMDFNELM